MQKIDECMDYLKKLEDKIGKGEISSNPLLEMLFNHNVPIIIYGAGAVGHAVYNILRKHDIDPQYFCSGLASGYIDYLTGKKVIHKDELQVFHNGIVILSIGDTASQAEKGQIKEELAAKGYREEQIIHHYALEEKISPTFFLDHEQEIRRVYDLLAEEESREIYVQKLKYMVDYVPVRFESTQKMYIDQDIVAFDASEVVIDAGAYDGDTALLFREIIGLSADIYSFEPDSSNYNNLETRVGNDKRIHLEKMGLWNRRGILHFSNDSNGSSHIENNGELTVKVVDLDSYCAEKGIVPTYIKMDIEGAEMQAIGGAEETIKSRKPKLAICLYHRPEDIYEIPIALYKLNPSYRMYIRHYSESRTDTVLYAV